MELPRELQKFKSLHPRFRTIGLSEASVSEVFEDPQVILMGPEVGNY
jgi:hypothetical protein